MVPLRLFFVGVGFSSVDCSCNIKFSVHSCIHTHRQNVRALTLAHVCVRGIIYIPGKVARYAVARCLEITRGIESRTEETNDERTVMTRRDNYDARAIRLSETVEPMVAKTVVLFKFPAILPCARSCRLQRLYLARQVRPPGRQQRLSGSPPTAYRRHRRRRSSSSSTFPS